MVWEEFCVWIGLEIYLSKTVGLIFFSVKINLEVF